MAKRGRKPFDYEQYKDQLVNVLSSGATIKDACAYVGVSTDKYYDWCNEYSDFRDAVEKARAGAKVACVAVIRQAAKSNWTAAAWFLERSDPTSWGRRDILITLGLDSQQLKELKTKADLAGVDLPTVFEELINEFGTINTRASDSEE